MQGMDGADEANRDEGAGGDNEDGDVVCASFKT